MIKVIGEKNHYYDKNGKEILDGSIIKWPSGKVERVYATDQDELGTDATNPKWIETGRAIPCEYGVYPLSSEDTEEIEVLIEEAAE